MKILRPSFPLFLIALAAFLVLLNPARGQAPATPLTIWPVGDSITAGYGPQEQGGYRVALYKKLKAAGIAVQFIGSSTLNSEKESTLVADNQQHHDGHGGYRIDQINKNLDGPDNGDSSFGGYWATGGHNTGRQAINPDIILVHVGTNDILQNNPLDVIEQRMTKLIDYLGSHFPNSKIFVAEILPIRDRNNADATVKAFNTWVEGQLTPRPDFNHLFYLVDMHTPMLDASGNMMHSPDGIHPDTAGYQIMADTWYKALVDAHALPAR